MSCSSLCLCEIENGRFFFLIDSQKITEVTQLVLDKENNQAFTWALYNPGDHLPQIKINKTRVKIKRLLNS